MSAEALAQAQLEIMRLRKILAAYQPEEDRPASAVTPTGGDRLDWLRTRLQGGLGIKTRDAARRILDFTAKLPPEARAEVVECLHDMADETDRWKNAWSATSVQADRDVRAAAARSLDCDRHGDEIRDLMATISRTERDRDRTEAARLSLVAFLDAVRTAIDHPEMTPEKFREYIPRALHRAEASHRRHWTKP